MHLERLFQGACVLDDQRPYLVRLEQPFVRIQPH